jgi:toxin HigB-1
VFLIVDATSIIDSCKLCRYTIHCYMIKTWQHAGLRAFFETGSKAGIQPAHASKLTKLLTALNVASKPHDMGVPAWRLHPLKGDRAGHWSVDVNGNYRITFKFEGPDVILVDYLDTH